MGNMYPPGVTIPVYAVFTAVAIILTAARWWARIFYFRSRPGPDDYLILFGVTIVTVCAGMQFYNALEGTGGAALSPSEAEHRATVANIINYVMIVIEKPAFGAIKMSLLFFYRRIFGVLPGFRKVDWTMIAIIGVWTLGFFLTDLLICGANIDLNWALDQTKGAEQCGDKGLSLVLFAATGVATDLMVLLLPFFFMRKLQMPTRKKMEAASVFMLGFVATFAGLLRTIFLCISYPMGRLDWGYEEPPNADTPLVLDVFNPTFWVMVEITLGAWAANLPPLGPMLRNIHLERRVTGVYRKFSSAYTSSRGSSERKDSTEKSHSMEEIYQRENKHSVDYHSSSSTDVEHGLELPLQTMSSSGSTIVEPPKRTKMM